MSITVDITHYTANTEIQQFTPAGWTKAMEKVISQAA